MRPTPTPTITMTIRVPVALYRAIERAKGGQSQNGYIVATLEAAVGQPTK